MINQVKIMSYWFIGQTIHHWLNRMYDLDDSVVFFFLFGFYNKMYMY